MYACGAIRDSNGVMSCQEALSRGNVYCTGGTLLSQQMIQNSTMPCPDCVMGQMHARRPCPKAALAKEDSPMIE
ncbi:hypothetical protein H4R18_000525 [Coemansia javaensis]|uniref:Uncharacterized protein n=1 Tax=Coemansia javaensis TaxID=2761396 RepID=A0A9W8LMP0_9FUNG|nr:hypothetical protein H4R18_000525 [Coemansia javaensis]